MNLCKLVKDELKYDAVFCLKPNTCEGGLTQACHAVDYQGVEYFLDFWDKKYNVKLFVNHSNNAIRIVFNNKQRSFDCLSTRIFAKFLYEFSREGLMLFLHSLFCGMVRECRAAYAAYAAYAAADAAADAAYAAYAADAAAHAVCAAAHDADAADAADAAHAVCAAHAADTAYAVHAAYAAAHAVCAAAHDADAADAAADAHAAYAAHAARRAFKLLIKLRKLLFKREMEK